MKRVKKTIQDRCEKQKEDTLRVKKKKKAFRKGRDTSCT